MSLLQGHCVVHPSYQRVAVSSSLLAVSAYPDGFWHSSQMWLFLAFSRTWPSRPSRRSEGVVADASVPRPPMLLRSCFTSCSADPLTAAGSLLLHSAYDALHKRSLFSSCPLPRCLCPHPGGSSDPRVLGVRRFPWGPTSGHTALSGHWPDAASKALSSSCPGAPFAVPGLGSALPSVLILTLAVAMFKDVENRRALAEEAKKKNPRSAARRFRPGRRGGGRRQ